MEFSNNELARTSNVPPEKNSNHDIVEVAAYEVAEGSIFEPAGTRRGIKSRHAQMIALGGSIGTGLFVSTGQALAIGGPAFLFIGYCLTSLIVYGVLTAIVEVTAHLPLVGRSIDYYCGRYVSPSIGFALGWLYFYSFGVGCAQEITAASIVISFWPNTVPIAAWITIMLTVIIALNLMPVSWYAEAEFWFAGIKIIMLFGLLILSLVLMLGGGPNHERLGFYYWQNPGATNTYLLTGSAGIFTAFLKVWILCGVEFYFGPEQIIFTAGELRNPRGNLPKAARRFFARLVFFYVLGTLAIGVICNSQSPDLLSDTGNANASPWVIAIRNAGISALPSIVNAGILTSAWSAGNTTMYMASRSLYFLAMSGNASRIFARCNSYGLPIYAVGASSCFALLAYLKVSLAAGQVFNWLLNLSNTAGFTSWIVCCITFLRFRKACAVQGQQVPYRSKIKPYAAWISLIFCTSLLLANGFTVFYPGQFTASGLLTAYLGIPVFVALWLGHKLTVGRRLPWM